MWLVQASALRAVILATCIACSQNSNSMARGGHGLAPTAAPRSSTSWRSLAGLCIETMKALLRMGSAMAKSGAAREALSLEAVLRVDMLKLSEFANIILGARVGLSARLCAWLFIVSLCHCDGGLVFLSVFLIYTFLNPCCMFTVSIPSVEECYALVAIALSAYEVFVLACSYVQFACSQYEFVRCSVIDMIVARERSCTVEF